MEALTLNWDFAAGRALTLGDLFKPGAAYLPVLTTAAQKSLAERGILDDREVQEGSAPVAANFAAWTLAGDGLQIVFAASPATAAAPGPQAVVIPYADLSALLRPDGPAARVGK